MAKTEAKTASKPKKVTRAVKTKVQTKATDNVGGFVEFIRTQGVIGLAIGLVIGTQVKSLVDQFLRSFVDPLLGLFIGGGQGLGSKTLYVQVGSRSALFGWGAFLYALIDFVTIAAVIFFTFKWLRLDKLDKKKD
jgi:large conductance mechanosensitive channel